MAPERLPLAAHYVIARTQPHELGATKLNKILWYADLWSYRVRGETITGLGAYIRMTNGPVPDGIEYALNQLKRDGRIHEVKTKVIDYDRREFFKMKEPDVGAFTPEEVDILNVFIAEIKPHAAGYVSDVTHRNPLWRRLNNGDKMFIGAASVMSRPPSDRELAWAQAQANAAH